MAGVDHSGRQFYVVERTHGGVVVRRTEVPHRNLFEVTSAFASIYAQLEHIDLSRLPLLVDLRAVIGRNDDSFEEEVAPHRRKLIANFARTGVLVRTTVGAMQIRRLFASEGIELAVFTSEPAGLLWLQNSDDPPA